MPPTVTRVTVELSTGRWCSTAAWRCNVTVRPDDAVATRGERAVDRDVGECRR